MNIENLSESQVKYFLQLVNSSVEYCIGNPFIFKKFPPEDKRLKIAKRILSEHREELEVAGFEGLVRSLERFDVRKTDETFLPYFVCKGISRSLIDAADKIIRRAVFLGSLQDYSPDFFKRFSSYNPWPEIQDKLDSQYILSQLNSSDVGLTPSQRRRVGLFFGLKNGSPLTLEEIAEKEWEKTGRKVTRQAVYHSIHQGIEKLRKYFESI